MKRSAVSIGRRMGARSVSQGRMVKHSALDVSGFQRPAIRSASIYSTDHDSSQNTTRHRKRDKDHIQELIASTESSQDALRTLPAMPPVWEDLASTVVDVETSDRVLQQVQRVLNKIKMKERSGDIRPTSKNRHELSNLFRRLLDTLARASTSCTEVDTIEPLVSSILNLMETWKLNLQEDHVECAATALGRSGAWDAAADLAWKHVDPELAGYNPVDISVTQPTLLYVIARAAEDADAPVVEHVMDAVRKLCMVSPTDKDTYVLAAGTTIGLLGRYKELIDYQHESLTASQLGQPLVVAIMRAALLSGAPEEALVAFQNFVDLHEDAGEWQWGGGVEKVHPLLRDLAVCSMGHAPGMSDLAVEMLRELVADGESVSVDAFKGVALALEKDGDVQEAMALLFDVLRLRDLDFIVRRGYDLSEFEDRSELVSSLQAFLIPIMRLCNRKREFGLSQLSMVLFSHSMADDSTSDDQLRASDIYKSILRNPDLLGLSMASLCALGSTEEAVGLYDSLLGIDQGPWTNAAPQLKLLRDACVLDSSYEDGDAALPWNSWSKAIATLLDVDSDHARRSWNLASAINAASVLYQPLLGIMTVKWFLADETRPADFDLVYLAVRANRSYLLTDELLAALMNSLTALGDVSLALELFGGAMDHDLADYSWTLSSNAAIQALVNSERYAEAKELFENVIAHTRNPDTFTIMAKGHAAAGDMSHVMETYRLATSSGSLSEELAMLALKAIHEVQQEGHMRALRGVVHEISQATGMKSAEWIESKYWRIKRQVAPGKAKALMFWNDMRTSYLDEFQFALESFDERKKRGLPPRTDVIRCIINAAARDRGAARDRSDLKKLPRSQKEWSEILERTLNEVRNTGLKHDSGFIDLAAQACTLHDCRSVHADFVKSLLEAGGNVRPKSLRVALEARGGAGNDTDLRMLVSTPRPSQLADTTTIRHR